MNGEGTPPNSPATVPKGLRSKVLEYAKIRIESLCASWRLSPKIENEFLSDDDGVPGAINAAFDGVGVHDPAGWEEVRERAHGAALTAVGIKDGHQHVVPSIILSEIKDLWPPSQIEAVREVMVAMAKKSEEATTEGTEAERWLFRLREALDSPKEEA